MYNLFQVWTHIRSLFLTGAVFVAQESDALWPLSTLAAASSPISTISLVESPVPINSINNWRRVDFTTPVFAWTIIESSLAVVGANLPLFRPLLLRMRVYTSSPRGSGMALFSSRVSRWSRGFSLNDNNESDPPIQLLGRSISNQDLLKRQDTTRQKQQTVLASEGDIHTQRGSKQVWNA